MRNSNCYLNSFKKNTQSFLGAGLVASTLALSPAMAAWAQDAGAPSNPIDIQADEQEFGDDRVIARGKVKVVNGDTIIRAPMATLFRDEMGQPKLAIFTGSPTLVQGTNTIKALKLTFDIKLGKILAEGNAHSEVMSNSLGGGGDAPPPKQPPKKQVKLNPEDEPEPAMPDEEGADSDVPTDPTAPEGGAKKPAPEAKPQKIITDSDRQEFERASGRFEAHGNVRVITQGINVKSNHLKLIYGTDQKAEAVLFTGDVTAKRESNVTQSDTMTYFLTTQRLQATGHVKSRVIQEKATGPKKGGPQASSGVGTSGKIVENSGQEIIIFSDAQDYNKENGRVDAEGRVKLFYGATTGIGPKISLIANEYGQTDKVIFIGRSQVTQPGRRWIADRITYLVDDNKVLAEGNTRAIIIKSAPGSAVASGPAPSVVPQRTQPSSRLVDDGRNKIQ